jgi:hypothetical protein
MRGVFELRAQRIAAIYQSGRLGWLRETGTRVRLLDSVEHSLLRLRENWDDIVSPTDPELIEALLAWAWTQPDVMRNVSVAYRENPPSREVFKEILTSWIEGAPIVDISTDAGLDVNDMLEVHTRVLTYALHVNIEQAISLLTKFLETDGRSIAQAVTEFPEYLRFGVSTPAARALLAGGVRHRRAAVELGRSAELREGGTDDHRQIFLIAQQLLTNTGRWLPSLGRLVLENTIADVSDVVARFQQ